MDTAQIRNGMRRPVMSERPRMQIAVERPGGFALDLPGQRKATSRSLLSSFNRFDLDFNYPYPFSGFIPGEGPSS